MDEALILSQQLSETALVDTLLKKFRGYENLKRVQTFSALDGERKFQERFNSRKLSVGEELCLLQCYVNKAMTAYADTLNAPSEPATMEVIRKIGAMCVRAMENHGPIEREK
jgi:hypothetical protein